MSSGNAWRKREQNRRNYLRRKGVDIPPDTDTRGPGKHTQRFVAIDGEGGDRNGQHIYTLLVAAGKNYADHIDNSGEPLGTKQCLDFILGLPRNRHIISFYFNYDVTMICRDMPDDVLKELCDRDSRTNPETGRTKRVYWQGYGLDWIPGKMFIVDKLTSRGRNISRTVWDTAGFFQSSLVRALEGWDVGTPEEKQFVQGMKNKRAVFTGEVTREVIKYAETECVLLCKLMDLVYNESKSLGYTLHSYSGAGSLANSIMGVWKIEDAKTDLPKPVEVAAYHAYFGGRFEVVAIGEVPGPIYEMDINSAYPYAIQSLPDLANGEWRPADWVKGDHPHEHGIYRVRWHIPHNQHSPEWGPLPWRGRGGGISYPLSGEGWYWGVELQAVMRTHNSKYLQVVDGWQFIPGKNSRLPFSDVPRLYARRAELKRQGHLGQLVLKLGLNSLYGKTAQSVGARRYASIVWAGMITATARAMLTDAIRLAGNNADGYPNVVMCATDAVYSRVPIPELDVGKGLGQWGLEEHSNLLIVQPGLYALNVGMPNQEAIRKTRGIRKTAFDASDVLAIWRQEGIFGSFDAPTHSFVGLKRGMISAKYSPGEWVDEKRTVSFTPRSKRLPFPMMDGDVTYLPAIPADRETVMSKMYEPKQRTPELADYLLLVGNDTFQPNAGEERPSIIPGFQIVGG